jgi:hypothetical protein
MKYTQSTKEYRRNIRRSWRPTIRGLIRKAGFVVKNVQVIIDANSDPDVGFIVKVVGKDTVENRMSVELALRNFAYNITFVKA